MMAEFADDDVIGMEYERNTGEMCTKRGIGRVALVHDFLLYRGGAERVLRALSDVFPSAPIYTLLYDAEGMKGMFEDRIIRTSFLGSWPLWARRRHRLLLPFYPTATEAIDLRDFDLVISSSGAWTKGIVTRLRTKHIAYVHSPMRFVWDENEKYLRESARLHFFKRMMLSSLRLWDFESAQRPDILVANSRYTSRRIEKYYRRESEVVYPPVGRYAAECTPAKFKENRPFIVVSRLSPYKHTREIIEAFRVLRLPLLVVGSGREHSVLVREAPANVKILGDVSDTELARLYAKSRAFVFASDEDFGMALAEANAAGLPAIALRRGGAREIIEDGISGVFFDDPDASAIVEAVRLYIERESSFDRTRIAERGERFSESVFREKILSVVMRVITQ